MEKNIKYGVIYYKDTDNIGDDIQTYAAMCNLPHVDYFIDREKLDSFVPDEKGQVVTLMNGWYLHKRFNFPISPYIYPISISMHFSSNDLFLKTGYDYLDGYARDVINSYGAVGCRDYLSKEQLDKLGYDTYYSGCVTMTIPPVCKRNDGNYICCVDLKESLYNHIKKISKVEVKKMTHWVDPCTISNLSIEKRMENVKDLLKTYQNATLVVTDRLHTALPCLALSVPVLLIYYPHNADRLSNFLKYVSNVSEEQFLKYSYDDLLKIKNPSEHVEVASNIKKTIKDKIESLKLRDVPEIGYYIDTVKRLDYLKNNFLNKIYENMDNINNLKYQNSHLEFENRYLREIYDDRNRNLYSYYLKLKNKVSSNNNRVVKLKKITVKESIVKFDYDVSFPLIDSFYLLKSFVIDFKTNMEKVPSAVLSSIFVSMMFPLIIKSDNITLNVRELDSNFDLWFRKFIENFKKKHLDFNFNLNLIVDNLVTYDFSYNKESLSSYFDGKLHTFKEMIDSDNIISCSLHYDDEYSIMDNYLKSVNNLYNKNFLHIMIPTVLNTELSNIYECYSTLMKSVVSSICALSMGAISLEFTFDSWEFDYPCLANFKYIKGKDLLSVAKDVSLEKKKGNTILLKSCSRAFSYDNCTICESCAKDMLAICSLKEDPREYGFPIISNTYDVIKYRILNGDFLNDEDGKRIKKELSKNEFFSYMR